MSFETIHILKMKCELELVDESPEVRAGEDTHGDTAQLAGYKLSELLFS